jgi:hypothetical protein
MEVRGKLHSAAALSLVKEPRYPLDRTQSGPYRWSERGGDEKY